MMKIISSEDNSRNKQTKKQHPNNLKTFASLQLPINKKMCIIILFINNEVFMELWQIWGVVSIIFFIVEMFTPTTFFLNLGLASLISALTAWLGGNFSVQVIIFALFSAICLIFLRPILIKKITDKSSEFDEKYKNQTAVVVEKITPESGRIGIYGETWQAKSIDGSEIEKDSQVKIIRIESIIMYVEKI